MGWNTLCHDAIMKEMQNEYFAFDIRGKDEKAHSEYKWIPLRLIFDAMIDFT